MGVGEASIKGIDNSSYNGCFLDTPFGISLSVSSTRGCCLKKNNNHNKILVNMQIKNRKINTIYGYIQIYRYEIFPCGQFSSKKSFARYF